MKKYEQIESLNNQSVKKQATKISSDFAHPLLSEDEEEEDIECKSVKQTASNDICSSLNYAVEQC